MKRHLFYSVTLVLIFVSAVAASTGSVDPSFDAVPSKPFSGGEALVQPLIQPDGKIVVWGPKTVVNGVAKGEVFRLNPDGSIDTGFSYCGCALTSITSLKLAPDGKILIAGSSPGFGRVVRLNVDGSIDSSFQVSTAFTPFGGSEFIVDAVQPDGRVFATRRDSAFGNVNYGFYRFNIDGSPDPTFTPINLASGSPMSAFVRIALLSDGRFYLAVTAGVTGTGASLRRYNPNGTQDGTWQVPSFSTGGFPSSTSIGDIAVSADGSILVAGKWDSVNGVAKQNFVRLLQAGNVDLNFTAPASISASGVEILPDGRLLVSLVAIVGGGNTIYRLQANGSIDSSFAMASSVQSILTNWSLEASGRIGFVGLMTGGEIRLVRLLPDGPLDSGFAPVLAKYGQIYAIARQSDGKMIIAGSFTHVNSVTANSPVRVNIDGTLDASFNSGTGFNAQPKKMIVQPDGKILAIGGFTFYDGDGVSAGIVRINSNGSRDTSFNVTTSGGSIIGLNIQLDGKILIAGTFTSINGASRTYLARLNSDGTLDATFNAIIGCCGVNDVETQADGKIVIGGPFSGVNGYNRGGLVRLNSDGVLDESLLATGAGSTTDVVLYPGGKYLLMSSSGVQRRNNDGSPDASFSAPTFLTNNSGDLSLNAVLVLSDGSILVGGRFDKVGTLNRPNLARLSPSGVLDVLFLQNGADGVIRSMIDHPGGKAMIGGDFTRVENTIKDGVARLAVPAFVNATPFDFNGDGRADFSVYRPSTGVWYHLYSNGQPYGTGTWGVPGDIPVPADFDGDGITDLAIWRPSSGDWWYKSSIYGALITVRQGVVGDIPRPADFDGDGKADFIVYRPSTFQWFRIATTTGQQTSFVFGTTGDQPLIGDFDGDGKADPAVFRPSTGDWWYAASASSNAFRSVHWGQSGDIPAPGDYDGDRKTDFAVYRPSEGGWYILYSSTGNYFAMTYGIAGDRPVPGDYDGDGRADIAVFRPSTGIWYLFQTTAGFGGLQWGLATDVAVPNAFLP